MDTVSCPNCGKQIQITQALRHQLEEKIRIAQQAKHKEELEKVKAQATASTEKRLKEQSQKELLNAKEDKRKLEEKLQAAEKGQREKEEKIKQEAMKEASDKYRLDKLGYEKKIADMQKAADTVQRKGKQGSQELQGEVLELDLEEKLRLLFPYDEFKPVKKGEEGADLVQFVKNKYGKTGSIVLWEFKRTKNWDKKWLIKLREDARNINANEAVIVSEALPDHVKVYEKIDGVWVTDIKYALYLARILREMGLRIAIAKSAVQHTDENLKKLHDYVLSEKFRHKIDRHREQTEMSIKLLEKKKREDEKYYRDQKLLLDRLADNTPQIYFDLQEILPSLPSIASIEPDLISGEESSPDTT